ncbi:TetR/AcrR family transcriptional regulator [Bacillota bacterium LX-D]|nr:TetR/AcrR family transcriptional regulator [Bacillota bacterium LX-D]
MKQDAETKNQSEKILLAAFHCISSKGYANVSLRDIANEAGVVLSQLNYYYKNKEGLFTEVIKLMAQKYLREVEQCLQKGDVPKDKISSLIKYFREMLKSNPALFRMLYDLTGLALWSSSFKDLLCNLFKGLSDLIEKHILHDIPMKENLERYSPKSIARMILGAMLGTAIQVILDSEEENLPQALNAVEIIFE